jgi:hypothetical protein
MIFAASRKVAIPDRPFVLSVTTAGWSNLSSRIQHMPRHPRKLLILEDWGISEIAQSLWNYL